MQEITIDGQVYQFNFGMGFLREINKTVTTMVEGVPGVKKNVGLRYSVMKLFDGDVETLADILDLANKGQNPRVTKALLDSYIDDESVDINEVFDSVMGFLKTANATKKEALDVLGTIEKEKARLEAEQEAVK